jgi:hypothetical protein
VLGEPLTVQAVLGLGIALVGMFVGLGRVPGLRGRRVVADAAVAAPSGQPDGDAVAPAAGGPGRRAGGA